MAGGAPLGNTNASKGKPWTAAIARALENRSAKGRLDALNELAERLLAKCDEGDITALKELGDRLEGKPAQAIKNEDGESFAVELIKRIIVKAGNDSTPDA
jgi:hypothetical protein